MLPPPEREIVLAAPIRFIDADARAVTLTPDEASSLWEVADAFDAATVSACTHCRSRLLAVVALVDVLDSAPPHPRARELVDLADEAPTMHVAVLDEAGCTHRGWRDPGYAEWSEIVTGRPARRGR